METALATLCEGLVRRGHELRAIVASSHPAALHESIAGVEVVRCGTFGSLRSVALTPGFVPAIRSSLRELNPDIVQLHLPNPIAGWSWLLAGDDRPLVISYHSDIVRQRWLAKLWEPAQRRLLGRAARIVLSTQALADTSPALRSHRGRCAIIPFGIDASRFESSDSVEKGEPYFLFVGRLVYYKGIDLLLRALAGTTLRARIVGDGPLRARWEALAAELGVSDRAQFLGDCDSTRLHGELAKCAALVLPSTHPSESFGIVQLEAMAASRPSIVARASAGVESVQVDGETGRVVEARDVEALRAAMLELAADAGLRGRMGAAARRRVEAHFGLDAMLDAHEALFAEVLGRSQEAT